MAQFLESTFERETVQLDGNVFVDCDFIGCELVYAGGDPPVLNGCRFEDHRFTFAGAAQKTIVFMRALYLGGFHEMIDKTCEDLRRPARDS